MGSRLKEKANPQLLLEQKSFILHLLWCQRRRLATGLHTSNRGGGAHSSLYSLRSINHFSTASGVFLPMESQKSGAIWNMWVLGLLFTVPFPCLWWYFLPEKGISDLGQKSEMKLFLIEKWHWHGYCRSANVIAKYTVRVVPWWKTEQKKKGKALVHFQMFKLEHVFVHVQETKKEKRRLCWFPALGEVYGPCSFSGR